MGNDSLGSVCYCFDDEIQSMKLVLGTLFECVIEGEMLEKGEIGILLLLSLAFTKSPIIDLTIINDSC